MVWHTYQMQGLINNITEKNVKALQTAEKLEIALVNQKGFVSYYFLDGDPEWLKQLGEYRNEFKKCLFEARQRTETQQQMDAIDKIESEYRQYITFKDQAITHHKTGSRQLGATLHQKVRDHFFKILESTEEFKNVQIEQIRQATESSHAQAWQLRIIAGSAIITVFLLGALLAFVLSNQVLGPVRRMALKADREGAPNRPADEVKALSRGVRDLMDDIDHSRSELEKSQAVILQAEKLALAGKLAAGTAHSIRNPLTSVKMRLFSLSRSLELNEAQKEDFEVISGEIAHVDTIVENFLEFSRPPKLRMQRICPSDVVDLAIKSLQHSLETYNVSLKVQRQGPIPNIEADPEQLKEVLLIILVNACEAMRGGGSIVVREEQGFLKALGKIAVIRLSDNGPGIPESIQDEIFQPFFTTKEEGTGLGLSIASRIVEQHEGFLDLISKEGEGATFVIVLPLAPAKQRPVSWHL
jgi:signal transduction histidine kinase